MYLDRKQVAERLTVSADTVTKLVRNGQIEAIKIGSQLRFVPAKVDEFIEKNTSKAHFPHIS